jgi:transcriptional regulator with XRE-family HTH domain
MARSENIYSLVAESAGRETRRGTTRGEMRLGEAVRRLREKTHISAAELCRRSGIIDPRTLSAVENGRIRSPSLGTLEGIAKGLGCLVSDLFTQAELQQGVVLSRGSQKGVFQMEFPKLGLKVVSATPPIADFFCGKLILAPLRKVSGNLPWSSHPLFFDVVIGRIEFEVGGEKTVLKEGENLFLRGGVAHTITNVLNRESALWFVTAPSFFH